MILELEHATPHMIHDCQRGCITTGRHHRRRTGPMASCKFAFSSLTVPCKLTSMNQVVFFRFTLTYWKSGPGGGGSSCGSGKLEMLSYLELWKPDEMCTPQVYKYEASLDRPSPSNICYGYSMVTTSAAACHTLLSCLPQVHPLRDALTLN
jgi:hypothetical protein